MSGGGRENQTAAFLRSERSVAFERMWRELPRTDLLPARAAFQPRHAKSFLSHIILAEAPSAASSIVRVRLVGDAIRQHVVSDIVGQDFLDFMQGEEARRTAALDIVRAMFERPSGLWWIAPVHYERGFSHYWELTAFPLSGNENAAGLILAMVNPLDGLFDTIGRGVKAIRVDPAVQISPIEIR